MWIDVGTWNTVYPITRRKESSTSLSGKKSNFLYWNILRARPETFAYPVTSFKGHCPLRPVSGATLRWTKEIEHHILVQMIWIRVPKVMVYLDCRYHGKHCTLNHFELLGLFPRSKKQGFTGLPKNLWITFHKCHRDSLFTNSSTRQSNYNYTNITQWENAPIVCQSSYMRLQWVGESNQMRLKNRCCRFCDSRGC